MSFSPKEILKFVDENDVKFIRLTFCDVAGNLKNIAVMPNELEHAFNYGIPFDASEFGESNSDLLLFPDISTLSVLPWRPKSGRVVRFFCSLKYPDGRDFAGDMRNNLINYINELRLDGYSCEMGTRCEFYLFELDEKGNPTKIPHDNGGYLDVAPLDKCENARREICLSLEEMGLNPKSSCHKHGSAQNEIEFQENEPVTAADDMVHYKTVVKSVAAQCGLFASFMPKPLPNEHGSALNISLSIKKNGEYIFGSSPENMSHEGKCFISGILKRIKEITIFLNPTYNSYERLSAFYAPKYINCSFRNDSPLIRIPKTVGTPPKIELRSADATCNPYIVFKLILVAGIEGIKSGDCSLMDKIINCNSTEQLEKLPETITEANDYAMNSDFVKNNLPKEVIEIFEDYYNKQFIARNLCKTAEETEEFECKFYFNLI
ncbi:MAG: glutamine synthetase family protein [Ruminococcus sp.]|nr:glutamine synthetase family protein [Ruminococcus sp.]